MKRVLQSLVALLVGLLLAELGARVVLLALDPRPSDEQTLAGREQARAEAVHAERARALDVAQVIHPYLGFVDEPGAEVQPVEALPRETARPGYVVGVFGGSVANLFADDPACARAFAGPAAGREVVVVNAAIGAHKQPQPLLALAYLLALGARFDAVLLLDGFNDMALSAENATRGVSPVHPYSWGLLLADLDADRQVRDRLARIGLFSDLHARATELERARSGIVALLGRGGRRWLDARLVAERAQLASARHAARRSYQVTGPSFGLAGEEAYRAMAETWLAASVQMQRLAEANGARFVHVLQPNQYAGAKPMDAVERATAVVEAHPYAAATRAGYPFLRAACAGQPGCHDMTDVFADVHEPLYVDSCCHFNQRGSAILGEAMAEILSSAR